MNMETRKAPEHFLKLVAKTFYEKYGSSIFELCFIFPNRRSGTFFMKELSSAASGPILSPKITTITDFLADVTGSVEVSKIEALFALYSKYRMLKSNPEDFDKFSYWGDIILNDFNDVDKYLTDPQRIFKNIKDFKEISSNFLTEEQIAVIKEFFGDNWQVPLNDTDHFWQNSEIKVTEEFTDIWNILYELYLQFNSELEKQGLSYSGRIYRQAAEQISGIDKGDFKYKQYVFVGFNVLSTSEIKIFKELDKKGLADFYWDCNSPALLDKRNKATLFISRNIAMFKPKLDINETKIDYFSPIHVVGTPSNIGQVKYIPQILDKLYADGDIKDKGNALNTAIVLPDENLFTPLLDSIPSDIQNVNVTMGYPLRLSAIATIITMIAKMHKQSRTVNGILSFFKEDVCDILSHPFVKLIAPQEASDINFYISSNNLYYLPADELMQKAPNLRSIFTPLNDTKSAEKLVDYVQTLIKFLEKNLLNSIKASREDLSPTDDDVEASSGMSVEYGFILQYVELLNQLICIILKYGFEMNVNTFFFLISRVLSSASIAFEGEPMKGLQIMGMLETRCLDFENLIILSMNERVFPRKHYSRSFIPNSLRRAFRMATVEFQDCMYAYYFYRMISRAKNIYLLYDARDQAMGSGEPSRYIEQLKVLYQQAEVTHDIISFNISVPKKISISIPKNKRIMEQLNKYRTPESGYFLSASAINMYINCPLSFYFEKVEKLRIEDEVSEFMDASMIGTIVHSVMQQIYGGIAKNNKGFITPNDIKRIKNADKELMPIIIGTINDKYSRVNSNSAQSLTGETQLVKDAIVYYVKQILSYDEEKAVEFKFKMAEEEETLSWNIGKDKKGNDLAINIKQFIDRVDELYAENGEPSIRIIDYKTGKDKTSASNIEQFFNPNTYDGRRKAMLQLMIYCNVYSIDKTFNGRIKPAIYSIKNMQDSGFKFSGEEIEDYKQLNDEFLKNFNEKIACLFDENTNFEQTENEDYCRYCKFSAFCHR